MKAEVLSQKFRREAVKEEAFKRLIRNETALPEGDVDTIKGLVCRTLAGVRDVCAIYPEDRFLDQKDSYTEDVIEGYNLQSSVIYLTLDQRELLKPDSPLYLELREIGLDSDEEGERARENVREIKRLQEIYANSYSPIELNVIESISLESTNGDRAFDLVIDYSVPHVEVQGRARNYKGAFELFNAELVTLATESGFATNGVQPSQRETGGWSYSSVKEDLLGAVQVVNQSTPNKHATA